MDFLVPKYRRDPNAKVESIYAGVAPGNRTVVSLRMPSLDRNSMAATKEYGPMLPRGVSGRVGVLVLGGMETTLDEMEYILQAKQAKKFVPKRDPSDIAAMCRLVAEKRNAQILDQRRLGGLRPKKKTVRFYLPAGYKLAPTREPGLKILTRI